jgi:hypothetical protein
MDKTTNNKQKAWLLESFQGQSLSVIYHNSIDKHDQLQPHPRITREKEEKGRKRWIYLTSNFSINSRM